MLNDTPQLSTYRAGPDRCTLLALPKASFIHLFGQDPSLLAELHIAMRGTECSMKAILDHHGARGLFTDFLRRHRGDRALTFHEKVTQFRKLDPNGFHAAARSVAQGIVLEFLMDSDFVERFTSKEFTEQVKLDIKDGNVSVDRLTQAQEEVFRYLEAELFARFKESEGFLTFLQGLTAGYEVAPLGGHALLDELEA